MLNVERLTRVRREDNSHEEILDVKFKSCYRVFCLRDVLPPHYIYNGQISIEVGTSIDI